MNTIIRFFRASYCSFKSMFLFLSPLAYSSVLIISPIFSLIFFTLIARDAYGPEADIRRFIIGNAIILCYVSAFFNIGNIWREERNFGTLKIVATATVSKFETVISKGFLFIFNGMITVIIGLLVGWLLYGITIEVSTSFVLAILLSVISVASMGCFIGTIGLLTRDANLILNIWNMIFMALCGINFPTERLPIALQHFSNFLPLRHSIEAIGMLLQGNNDISMLLIRELGICLGYMGLALITLKIFEKLSVKHATLDFH